MYPWQINRAHASVELPAPRLVDLSGVPRCFVHVSIARPEVPHYMRLDPERWPLTIAALACHEQTGTWSTWPEIREAFMLSAAALLGLTVEDLD